MLLSSAQPDTAGADDHFQKHVAPIFERHCVSCHSGGDPKGGLDLTTAAKAHAGGESGALLTAGKPDESVLLEYISGDKPQMPKDAPQLPADDVAAIRTWIATGAPWPEALVLTDKKTIDGNWWSLLPRQKVSVPTSDDPWIRTQIDAFILAKLHEQQLAPSPEADRRTLIRRLTYDLHGLPPTPEEIDAFVSNTSDDAYRNLVDRLLDSPRYGERWGRHWLDIVHFGESHGYDKDKPRPNAWPYRDYVIRSFNDDKPYDRFVAEQIAGDVLDPADPAATVATGFIAAGPWDFVGHVELREGTTDKEIARSNDRDDMLANAMSTFVSLTVHCARCHNHKFDPIKQTDYYALQAVFAGVDRGDRKYDLNPQIAARRVALEHRVDELAAQQKEIESQIATFVTPAIAAIDKSLAELRAEKKQLGAPESGTALGFHSEIVSAPDTVKWVQVDLGQEYPIEKIVLVPAHEVYGGHPGPGFGFPKRYKVEVSNDPEFQTAAVAADYTGVDVPHPGDVSQTTSPSGISGRYVRVTATRLWQRTNDWIFAISELLVFAEGRNVALNKSVTALDSIEAAPRWAKANLVDGYDSRERIAGSNGKATPQTQLDEKRRELERQREALLLDAAGSKLVGLSQAVAQQLADARHAVDQLPPQESVYGPTSGFEPRPIHLLARGDVKSPQELMSPGAVACVQGPKARFDLAKPEHEGERRAALAKWLIDPRNALLRRSIVNRVWQYHFGAGLVDSPNDFGRMGSLPTHPELLEWLAGWFADEGHSLKKLHRLLLLSSAYRQSSRSNEGFAKLDAGNRYLWRMNRTRLDAECVRDAMLYVSGKLDLTMGGPSVQQFEFKDDHSPIYDYARFDVDDPRGLRRSVYRFLVRSVPDPFMDSLDCADPSIMTPRRNTTLTAIQALAVLNNPLVVRQSEHLAARVSSLASEPSQQIAAVYRLALGRTPSEAESSSLSQYATKHGLANACRVILNSNEFMFVD